MNSLFEVEVQQSGYIHTTLPLHPERSLEAELAEKPALKSVTLWKNSDLTHVRHSQKGSVELSENGGREGGTALVLRAPLRAESFPEGTPPGAPYTNFGTPHLHLDLGGQDWRSFNRLSLYVKPDYPGGENLHLILALHNDGEIKIPDIYAREGYHVINLQNHAWNHMVWEFPDLPRDCITELEFYLYLSGNNGMTEKEVCYYIDDIALEEVAQPTLGKGWRPEYDTILYSTPGYSVRGKKEALTTGDAREFTLCRAQGGAVVFRAPVKPVETEKGKFGLLDFTDFCTPGEYYLQAGEQRTEPFAIDNALWEEAAWRTLNYLYAQRCGFPVSHVHDACHRDSIATHNGVSIVFNGGWHDAGDLSQMSSQSIEITHALFELAAQVPPTSQLHHRLMEEGEWGLDFATRVRFGDGYRITTCGAVRFTDGLIGNMDDITTARIHNHAIENLISAEALSYSSTVLQMRDHGRADHILKVAQEDYEFAVAEMKAHGGFYPLEKPGEHTMPSGEANFYAIASAAASQLYAATGEARYAADARAYAEHVLAAQELGEDCPVAGFFYRDGTHRVPQHFNHMSRESYFMRALVLLCRTQPDHADKSRWEAAMRLYGRYLVEMQKYIAPYAMAPSGVYALSEAGDEETFRFCHPGCKYETEKDNWVEQLRAGAPLGDKHTVRCYPVWFSFRGNSAVLLESGKAASLLGKYFNDEQLLQIGREQVYWVLGKNPSGQSQMWGMGRRYCQLYGMNTGETVGQLPVGMESFGNEDTHYFPQGNNCTYKEVWTTPSRSLLWLLADLV